MLEECSSPARYNRGKERTAECQGGFIYFVVQLFRTSPLRTYVRLCRLSSSLARNDKYSPCLSARPMKHFPLCNAYTFHKATRKQKEKDRPPRRVVIQAVRKVCLQFQKFIRKGNEKKLFENETYIFKFSHLMHL